MCVCVCMYVYTTYFIYSSVDGHVGFFYVLAIVNSAAVNIGVHVSLEFSSFPDICPGVGLLDHMVTVCRSLHTVLRSGCSNLHSYQQRRSVPKSSILISFHK